MNTVINQLLAHTSIRQYEEKPIPQPTIDAILQATQQAPSWINGQQMTIIRVTDHEKRSTLQALVGINDVGIALGTAVVAAESFGLGTVAIGGVRRDPQVVIDLLELPHPSQAFVSATRQKSRV